MKTALLVIDYINGIINGSCKDYANHHPIVANTNKLIADCRQKGIPIYFVRLAFDSHYTGIPTHSPAFNTIKERGLFQLDHPDTDFIDMLNYQHSDVIINKTAASPFSNQGLAETLQSQGIERLIFSGVATDNAINIGARQASDAGYYTVIVQDACGASSEQFHQWSIEMLKKIVNEIITADHFLTSSAASEHHHVKVVKYYNSNS